MYWPPLEFIIFYGLRYLYRVLDQKTLLPRNYLWSRTKTIQAFEEIYNGPEFSLHYKYSYIMVVVFVTFTFGAGLPVLFPLAFVSLLLFYTCERLMIAYSYMKPPMYNSKTNQRTLQIMFAAPIIYCANGCWMYSNQQLFRNRVFPNTGSFLFGGCEHSLLQFFQQITPGSVFFIYLMMMLVFAVYKAIDKNCFKGYDLRDRILSGKEEAEA